MTVHASSGVAVGSAHAQSGLWGARARDWADLQEGQVAPVYEAVLDELAIGPRSTLLDAGCGAGLAAQMAARRGADVTGLDATAPLLAIARERVPDGRFLAGDLEALPFADDAFDAVTGFNAFQFAANPRAALVQAGRVARPGGSVAIVTWAVPERCEAAVYLAALGPLLPPAPPAAPGPFALSSPGALEQMAGDAGLAPGNADEVACEWRYPDLDTALRGLMSAGPAVRAIQTSGEPAVRAAIEAAIRSFRDGSGGYRIGCAFRYLITTA